MEVSPCFEELAEKFVDSRKLVLPFIDDEEAKNGGTDTVAEARSRFAEPALKRSEHG